MGYKLCHDVQRIRSVCLPEVPSAKVVLFLPALSGFCRELLFNLYPKHPVILNVLIPLIDKVSASPFLPLNNIEQQNLWSLGTVEFICMNL